MHTRKCKPTFGHPCICVFHFTTGHIRHHRPHATDGETGAQRDLMTYPESLSAIRGSWDPKPRQSADKVCALATRSRELTFKCSLRSRIRRDARGRTVLDYLALCCFGLVFFLRKKRKSTQHRVRNTGPGLHPQETVMALGCSCAGHLAMNTFTAKLTGPKTILS